MKKILPILTLLYLSMFVANAQIKVSSNNFVGIGSAATSPLSLLSVGGNGNSYFTAYVFNSSTAGPYSFGLQAQSSPNSGHSVGLEGVVLTNANGNFSYGTEGVCYASSPVSSGRTYGVYGMAGNATSGYNYGVYGQLYGSNNGAAIFGIIPGYGDVDTQGKYAGYFQGAVKVAAGVLYTPTGNVSVSDERLKKNIEDISTSDGLFSLRPVKYNLKSLSEQKQVVASIEGKPATPDTAKNTITLPDPDYIKKAHFGFLAQDVQKIYPNLVYTTPDGTLGIDYQGFIPIIISQLEKMQKSLNDKDAKITDLENKVAQLEKALNQ